MQLKLWALRQFEALGIEDQSRRTASANTLAKSIQLDDGSQEALERVLDLDALNGFAWFNLGVMKSRAGEPALAGFCHVMAAISQPRGIEAWLNAFGPLTSAEGDAAATVLTVAYAYHGEDLWDHPMMSA